MRLATLPLVLFLCSIAQAQSPSFNCANAQSVREKAVCASPELSTLDTKIAHAYATTRAQLSSSSAVLVQQDQRDWLLWLDKVCPAGNPHTNDPAICLTNQYNARLQQLTTDTRHTNGLIIFTRAHFVFVPGKSPDSAVMNDPGFGYGEFAWPQIDNPTPAQQAWNDAVFATTLKSSCCIGEDKSITKLDDSIDADGYTDGFYGLHAANPAFISTDIGDSTYGWGAAHPNTGITHFNWWLSQNRELKPDDIFDPTTNWQQKLLTPAIAKLSPSVPPDNTTWKREDVAKSVAAELANSTAWSVSRNGLVIHFGQYEVGPYAMGMPTIRFTWKELEPYLNPNFHPADLPAAIPTP